MFHKFVGIDWSGAKTPKRSYSISLAHCNYGIRAPTALLHKLSRSDVYSWLCEQVKSQVKTFVGIDCNLGYAATVARKHIHENGNYWDLWCSIERDCEEDDNFFAGKWWTDGLAASDYWTSGKQPEWFDANALRRQCEKAAIANGLGTPESPFKLIGAKQVGKGGLAGMRVMHKLKTEFDSQVAIWPFEHKLVDKATLVVSENFPRTFIRAAGFGNQKLRTLEDLNEALKFFDCQSYETNSSLNDHLTDAIVASAGARWLFQTGSPLDVRNFPKEALEIEGWIFGVSP